MNRILIVGKNTAYTEFLTQELTSKDCTVDPMTSSIEGLEHLAKSEYRLIIADYNLETINGLTLIKSARTIDPNIRTVILSEYQNQDIEIAAIKQGVDLFLDLAKGKDVILLYIQNLLGQDRMQIYADSEDLYSETENIRMIVNKREVTKDGTLIRLSPKEFDVLRLFLENKSVLLSREDIISKVWSVEELLESTRIVDIHIQKIRYKLKTYAISTIRGRGYKWDE